LEENYRPDVLFVRTSADVVRTSARVRVYPADAILPADGFLPSADARVHPRGHERVRADACVRPRGHERVRADATMRPREKIKIKIKNLNLNFFLVVVAGLERE
jgi:hypothetical protein